MNQSTSPSNYLGQHAIVIGASMAGLLTARVLSDYFEKVTLVERDVLSDKVENRKGVPQGRHPHALLKRGEMIIEELFPGLGHELETKGAIRINMGADFPWRSFNNWRPRYQSEITNLSLSRALLETSVRQRLAVHPRVEFKAGWEVSGLVTDSETKKTTGITAKARPTQDEAGLSLTLSADLVVDASGRSSHAPQWLAELGLTPPRQMVIDAAPGYATRLYRHAPDYQADWKAIYIQPTPPHIPRGAILLPQEDNLWQVTLIGMNGDYPSTEEEGFMEFARSLESPLFYDAISQAEPATPIIGFRSGSNQWRCYEQMERYLENFLVLGDAALAFNPVYGQGMTVAAMSAMQLAGCLADHQASQGSNLTGLAEAFQKKLVEVINLPWQVSSGEDLRWPSTAGVENLTPPDPTALLMQNYLGQVVYATTQNEVVLEAFYKVMNMLETPNLFFRPDIVLQVAAVIGQATAQPVA